ncbi:MAG: sigma-70 family RNA polymerase sigma factor [Planctomycetes bacterium]|nr:sigma-70 family RNA polymerase sigma factor [Planctomycetota bacterium]
MRAINSRPQAFITSKSNSDDQQENILDHIKQSEINPKWRPSPDQGFILSKFGLDQNKMIANAKDFFNQLTREDRFIFKEHFIEGRKVASLAEQMNKPVEEIRKVTWQLGTGINNNQFPYPETYIGKWLADIGLFPDPALVLTTLMSGKCFHRLANFRACALGRSRRERRSGSGSDDPSSDA